MSISLLLYSSHLTWKKLTFLSKAFYFNTGVFEG